MELQRDMWPTMVTPIPMVLEYIMVRLTILVKSNYVLTRYLDPNMVYSNTMGIRVNMVDYMSLCSHGLSFMNINKISRGHGIANWP